MSKPQQVNEQPVSPVDEVKADPAETNQKGQNVMLSAEPEGSARQEVLDSSDDDDEYTTLDWNRGSKGRLRGYYSNRSKFTSAPPANARVFMSPPLLTRMQAWRPRHMGVRKQLQLTTNHRD
jgi:hypothetical protein